MSEPNRRVGYLPERLPVGKFVSSTDERGNRCLTFVRTSPFYLNTETGFLEWTPSDSKEPK